MRMCVFLNAHESVRNGITGRYFSGWIDNHGLASMRFQVLVMKP